MDDLSFSSIDDLSKAIADRSISPVEVANITLERIERFNGELRSFTSIDQAAVINQARKSESDIANGRYRGPLHGVPVSFKDLIDVAGLQTTGSSRLNKGRIAKKDAEVVAAFRFAGAVILGINTAYEFGLGLPMAGDWPEPARNPWDLERIPGGSSSGSAASVFAGLGWGSMGTDTGGSIRGPASYCGVVGLKPTGGWISTAGVMPLSETLDHVGPLARSVRDAAHLLAAASNRTVEVSPDTVVRAKIGVPRELVDAADLTPGVRSSFEDTLKHLSASGALTVEVSLPPIELTENALLTIIGTEGYRVHRESLESSPELYGPSARERLKSGDRFTEQDYEAALRTAAEVREQMRTIFEAVDLIVSPVTHTSAPTFADYEVSPTPRTLFTGIYNLIGAPSVSVPCGLDKNGMPLGFLISGPPGADARVLSLALAVEARFSQTVTLPTHEYRR